MVIIAVIVIGLVVGSFLNVVIFRLHSGKSFLFGRSACVACGRELQVRDLFPVVSFAMLQGRCRYCHGKISWQYPIVELTTGITFGLLAQNFQFPISNFQFWAQVIFACFLIVIAVYDYKHYLILNKVVFPAIALAAVWSIVNSHLISSLLGVLIISGFFGMQYWVSKGKWIGFGDVKLGVLLGLIFAKESLWFLVFAYFAGAIIALLLMVFASKKLHSRVPFGTILGLSAIIFLLWGDRLVQWYLKLIGI